MNQASSSFMPPDGHAPQLSYAERNAPYWRRNLFVWRNVLRHGLLRHSGDAWPTVMAASPW
ncbi:MAG: hypothetical protein QOD67_2923 [Caballeronia sp.]|jgi:hypothetical protein|nr:hypothetical protein [Caballeronia sp.]